MNWENAVWFRISETRNVIFPMILGTLPDLVEAWTRPQAEFGLLPAIRSLWCGFKPSVSKLCRAGQRHCSTRRPRDGFIALSPDKAWEARRGRAWKKCMVGVEEKKICSDRKRVGKRRDMKTQREGKWDTYIRLAATEGEGCMMWWKTIWERELFYKEIITATTLGYLNIF